MQFDSAIEEEQQFPMMANEKKRNYHYMDHTEAKLNINNPTFLEKDPTKDHEMRQREELKLERDMSQFSDPSTAIDFLVGKYINIVLDNKKLKVLNDQLTTYYFRNRVKVIGEEKNNSLYETQMFDDQPAIQRDSNTLLMNRVNELTEELAQMQLERTDLINEVDNGTKKIQDMAKENFDLKEKNHKLIRISIS